MGLLSVKDVQSRTTLSRAQIYRLEGEGRFPKRVSLAAGRVAWVEAEIDSWIADKIAARDQRAAG